MVFATLKFFPTAKQSKQLISILCSVRDLTQTLPDCVGCWLDNGGYLHGPVSYAEQWASAEALRQHLRSDLYGWLLVAMELSHQPPEVHFHYVAESKGMELVQQIRQAAEPEAQAKS